MEKVAITVLHGNISNSNKKLINGAETIAIAKVLSKIFNVDILSCKECDECIQIDEFYNINQYDKFFIVNGSINMFGGAELPMATTIHKLMSKFNGQIYYILTDLAMPIYDYWNKIKSKDWASKYSMTDFQLKNNIIILSQFSDLDYIKKIHKDITIADVKYIPWSLWKLELLDQLPTIENSKKEVDLIYGGSFRSGKRVKKMLEYFFNKDKISVELYGNISLDQFDKYTFTTAPKFLNKIPVEEVIAKNNSGIATLIIGDKHYNDSTITLRVWESLLSDALVFMDHEFNTSHNILKNDWLYVKSGIELEQKILMLKNDINLYNKLKDEQYQLIKTYYTNHELLNTLINIFN